MGKLANVLYYAEAIVHSRVAATLIGLGWVTLQQKDWSAARRHFAAALPLIEQLETAPQALEALAGIAHLRRCFAVSKPSVVYRRTKHLRCATELFYIGPFQKFKLCTKPREGFLCFVKRCDRLGVLSLWYDLDV